MRLHSITSHISLSLSLYFCSAWRIVRKHTIVTCFCKMDGPLALMLSLLAIVLLASSSPLIYSSLSHSNDHPRIPSATPRNPKFKTSRYKTECGTLADLSFIGCEVCKLAVEGLKDLVEKQSTEEDIVTFMTLICKKFDIEDNKVCDNIIKEYKVSFMKLICTLYLI